MYAKRYIYALLACMGMLYPHLVGGAAAASPPLERVGCVGTPVAVDGRIARDVENLLAVLAAYPVLHV